jgi:transcription antitermination factor NusB
MPAAPREIRRLAFQILFQLDVRGAADLGDARTAIAADEEVSDKDLAKADTLARAAFDDRKRADDVMRSLAPTWPAHRQAAVDRAILRLAHYEMTAGGVPPKIVINEAVELAKSFSTEKSPTFVNGLLDKIMKKLETRAAKASAVTSNEPAAESAAEPDTQ